MFQRIVVPLDGSLRAERAIPVAARIARASGGSVVLLRVVSRATEPWLTLGSQPTRRQQALDAELTEAETYLSEVATRPKRDHVPTETVALSGSTASAILDGAHSCQADLIVLCSHGYTGMTRWVLGSVAEKVARHADVPVLILREGGPLPAGPHPDAARPLRALVALDGSAHAKAALEPAASLIAALAAPASGALHLLRVVPPMTAERGAQDGDTRSSSEQVLHKAKRYLSATVEHVHEGLTAHGVADLNLAITWSVAVETDVASAIIRLAENGEDAQGAGVLGGCDVIAMATHGYSGLQHWAMGSITQRVLGATKLPLLVVRPPEMMDQSHVHWDRTTIATIQG
jgi:nucleotide-binding universal stress UspA family protein